jgi:hypothetical protein
MFLYNGNQTQKKEIGTIIYEENALNYHHRVDHRPRCLPSSEPLQNLSEVPT